MSLKLSEGCLMRIAANEKVPGPIVQVIDMKLIATSGATAPATANKDERYRVVLSDGQHIQQALLATQCNELIRQGKLRQFHVCRLLEFCLSDVQGRKVVIIARLEVLQPFDSKIGNPVPIPTVPQPPAQPQKVPTIVAPLARPAAAVVPPKPPQQQQSPAKPVQVQQLQRSQPPQQQQQAAPLPPPPATAAAAPPSGPGEDLEQLPVHPIKSLNPYQNRWVIRARVTNKTPIKEYNNARGPGKLFSVDLLDSSGDEIRATAFNEQVDRLFPMLEIGNVYLISRGSLKVANKRFTNITHEYEISFNSGTVVQRTATGDAEIPRSHYSFTGIDKIATEKEKDEVVDVIGIVTAAGELTNITQKSTGAPLSKRTITLLDMSSHSIELAIWGEKAVAIEVPQGVVVAARSVKVTTYNTKSLTASASSVIEVSPDIEEAHKLRGWFDAQGGNITIYPVSQYAAAGAAGAVGAPAAGGGPREEVFRTFGSVKDEQVGMSDTPEYFSAVGVVTLIKHDNKISYQACPAPKCGAKVTLDSGQFFCAKCNKNYPQCSERYILSLIAADHTGSSWLSCFNETATTVLGNIEASALVAMRDQAAQQPGAAPGAGEQNYERVFYDASFKWFAFRIRAKSEVYREEQRTRLTVVSVKPIDFIAESKRLLGVIASYGI